jgi:hypothetical protein
MNQTYLLLFLILAMICSCESENGNKYGTLIVVPDDIASIKEAIKIAQPYDTILIKTGEYFESNLEINKPLTLTSGFIFSSDTSLIANTIIDASSESRILSIMNIADTLWINGISMRNGKAFGSEYDSRLEHYEYDGGGISCYNAKLKLTNSIISNSSASGGGSMKGTGGGLYLNESIVLIDNVLIEDNFATYWSGGIYCDNSTFVSNELEIKNSKNYSDPVTIAFIDSYFDIRNTLFENNTSTNLGYYDITFIRCQGILKNTQTIKSIIDTNDCAIEVIDSEIDWWD